MEEKIIIQSKRSYIKTLKKIIIIQLVALVIGAVLLILVSPVLSNNAQEFYNEHKITEKYSPEHLDESYRNEWTQKWNTIHNVTTIGIVLCIFGGTSIFLLLFLWAIAKMEINVTNKRVYGKTRFGKRVDLPLDSISAVATGILKSITVATSSGKIHFTCISNNKEIHEAISKLLIERQGKEKPVATTTIKQEIPQSNADELKKYKDLLDSGVITQEEFDAKKKQLLGL